LGIGLWSRAKREQINSKSSVGRRRRANGEGQQICGEDRVGEQDSKGSLVVDGANRSAATRHLKGTGEWGEVGGRIKAHTIRGQRKGWQG
jgi:hypothetical protein